MKRMGLETIGIYNYTLQTKIKPLSLKRIIWSAQFTNFKHCFLLPTTPHIRGESKSNEGFIYPLISLPSLRFPPTKNCSFFFSITVGRNKHIHFPSTIKRYEKINNYSNKILSTRSAKFNKHSIIEYLRKSWSKLYDQFLHMT